MTTFLEKSPRRAGPIFIGGIGGSGTRAVADILKSIGLPIGSGLNVELDAMAFEGVCERFTTAILEQTGSTNYALEAIDPALRLRVLQALELAAAVHVDGLTTTNIWIAKSPRLLHFLPFLAVAFPGMRFAHVVRDGRDMALSANQNQPRKHFRAMFRRSLSGEPSLDSIRFWSHANVHAATFGQLTMGRDYQVLRYEDLCAKPEQSIQGLLTGLGLAVNETTLSRLARGIRPSASQGRWRDLPGPGRQALEEAGDRGLSYFGYRSRGTRRTEEEKPSSAGETALLVVGCHRSGTSLAAGILSGLGFDIGRSEMPPTADNPTGYWENTALVAWNDRLLDVLGQDWRVASPRPARWTASPVFEEFVEAIQRVLAIEMAPDRDWCIKDPRLCRLLPPWIEALRRLGRTRKVLLVLRHPLEVAASLSDRDEMSLVRGLRLWAMDVRRSVRDSGQAAREIVLYDTFLERPEATRAKVAGFAGDGTASGLAGDAEHPVNPALKHHKLESLSAPEDVDLREAVDRAWKVAMRLAAGAADAVLEEFDAALSALLVATDQAWLGEASDAAALREAETESQRLRANRALDNVRVIGKAGSPARALERNLVCPLPETEGSSKYQQWVETIEPLRLGQATDGAREALAALSAAVVLLPHGTVIPPRPPLQDPGVFATGRSLSLVMDGALARHWSWQAVSSGAQALATFPAPGWLAGMLREVRAAWYIFVEPDTRLSEDFLEIFAATIARQPNAMVAHGDYDFEPPGGLREHPVFKPPTWDDDLHLQRHVMRGWFAVRRDWLETCPDPTGRSALEVSYALSLLVTEKATPDAIVHIPGILAHLRPAAAREAMLSADALNQFRRDSLARRGWNATVEPGADPMTAHIRFSPKTGTQKEQGGETPRISVIIPTRDGGEHLAAASTGCGSRPITPIWKSSSSITEAPIPRPWRRSTIWRGIVAAGCFAMTSRSTSPRSRIWPSITRMAR